MEFDFLCFNDEVHALARSEVEVGGSSSGDVGGESRAAVGLVCAPDPDRGSVAVHFGDGQRDDVAGAGVWSVELNRDRGGPKQSDRGCTGRGVAGT